MILPNKYISISDSVFTTSAMVLINIKRKPNTIDKLWETCDKKYNKKNQILSYDKFIMSLIFMYSCSIFEINENGEISI